MEQVLYLFVGAVLTWTFYFVQRRVERRTTVDAIERGQKLLALKQGLDVSNTSLDDLRHFETRLIGKAEIAARLADNYFSKAEEVARQSDDDGVSQDDMNRQAIAEFKQVDHRLQILVAHLRSQLDGDGRATFEDAHRAWMGFRERYARFISQSYTRGSVRTLIRAVTLESVTTAWITELETQLGDDRF
ncbi:lysozyme inhibitor LprI family protein [Lysobacter silvisoli]|uniref:DUF1311 domain-containing protein n=1 Tax=Lysobacter silvisoli TaxID=2293254 RepID=A0A371JWE4_9GAMM|nr:lysozyme inhibitor LprI family protein [Lysobacter silvisoli]RDZ25999.1 DUF1311 domain-containing protein [Lysobacter silvisoli]